ncbi:MAG: hypothetical protein GY817_02590 [bacterium]|nr:hypothetical protein [bacterium]
MVELLFNALIMLVLVIASIFDIKKRIIPDSIHLILMLLGFFFGEFYIVEAIFVFAFILLVFKIGQWIFKKDTLGFGDVKLFTALGFLFGFFGFLQIFFYSFLSAGVYGLIILAFKKSKDHTLPFVPFINIAVLYFMLRYSLAIL